MSQQMSLVSALEALKAARNGEVIITAMGAAREWMELSSDPLDFIFVPSSMGQATSLGLGVAIAQPQRNVVVCNGDGSMLMNLGSLVSMTAKGPQNLTVLLFDNGVYEVTGSQPTPGAAGARSDNQDIDFRGIAAACGFRSLYEFSELEEWQQNVREVLDNPGPTFAVVKVGPMREKAGPRSPSPGKIRASEFRRALNGDDGE